MCKSCEMNPNHCTPWREWDGVKCALPLSRTGCPLCSPSLRSWNGTIKASESYSRIPVLCFSWRSVVGIMKKPRDGFTCCIKGFPCLRETVLCMRHLQTVRNNKEWVGLWGMDAGILYSTTCRIKLAKAVMKGLPSGEFPWLQSIYWQADGTAAWN